MNTMWKLFTGDIKRLTSNVVSIIIVIGLVMIPGLFTWFNVAACWDPFSNCLLYTSPSPRDAHESRMPSSA